MLSFSALLNPQYRRFPIILRANILSNNEAANQARAGADQAAIDQSSQPAVFTPVFNILRIAVSKSITNVILVFLIIVIPVFNLSQTKSRAMMLSVKSEIDLTALPLIKQGPCPVRIVFYDDFKLLEKWRLAPTRIVLLKLRNR